MLIEACDESQQVALKIASLYFTFFPLHCSPPVVTTTFRLFFFSNFSIFTLSARTLFHTHTLLLLMTVVRSKSRRSEEEEGETQTQQQPQHKVVDIILGQLVRLERKEKNYSGLSQHSHLQTDLFR